MAIKNLGDRARFPEIGRIRLGDRELVDSKDGKRKIERPKKGDTLRFTSNDEIALKAIASQHGGEVIPWEKGEQAWQLTSETQWIEALLPPDPLGDTPIYERWGAGGVQRRCDGERCLVPVGDNTGGHLEECDCQCLLEGLIPGDGKDTKACKVTVRIRLVLPYVPGLGIWLCTSHSWLGALELPGQVAVIDGMRERGQLILVRFGIEHRTTKKPWESFTREFIVPSVRTDQSMAQLQAAGAMLPQLTQPGAPKIAPGAQPALPASSTETPPKRAPAARKAAEHPEASPPAAQTPPPAEPAPANGRLQAIKTRHAALPDMARQTYNIERKGLSIPSVEDPHRWTDEHYKLAENLLAEVEGSAGPVIRPSAS